MGSFVKKIAILLEMIKFEHTLFVLPFAYLGSVLGGIEVNGHLPTWAQIGWITLAMIGARSAAMALNRIIDRHIDKKNPRTQERAIPAGKISILAAWVFTLCSFLLLFIAAFQLNWLALQLSPIAVLVLVIYSYTKRFTWACHFVLGAATALGPIGGWIATTGQVDGLAILLFMTVACWISGFDIIYACQDVEFDKKEGLYSIPAHLGIHNALLLSAWLHIGTAIGLIGILLLSQLALWFSMGVFLSLGILVYEHSIISANNLSRINTAFFTMNGALSLIVFLFALLDVLL